jgi:hypothetical protein
MQSVLIAQRRNFSRAREARVLLRAVAMATAVSIAVSISSIGAIERFMVEDHERIDRVLRAAERDDGSIDAEQYTKLRHDLLRHIGMEEKVLLPFVRAKRGGEPLPIASTLRADHSEIAKLLVRSPTAAIIASLREIMGRHNALEEAPDGLYATCDALAGDESAAIVDRLRAQPNVPLAKYYDGPVHRRVDRDG